MSRVTTAVRRCRCRLGFGTFRRSVPSKEAFSSYMFAATFIDPGVDEVRFDLAGDPAAFCATSKRDVDCAVMTGAAFFRR